MQDDMIQIRNKPLVAHGEQSDTVFKTFIVALKFSFTGSKEGEIPVTHELNNKPEQKNPEKNPSSCGLKAVKRNQTKAVQTQHSEFSAFYADPFYEKMFPDSVRDGTAKKPYPQCSLANNGDHHICVRLRIQIQFLDPADDVFRSSAFFDAFSLQPYRIFGRQFAQGSVAASETG